MGYGMKYTNGGFPFKASPAKQKENTTPHFLEQKPNPTVKAIPKQVKNRTKEEQIRFMNDKDHQSVPTITDFIGQGVHNKHKTKIKPSFPATPAGNKARAAAEKAQEVKEDAEAK